jgi:hypothetical protein
MCILNVHTDKLLQTETQMTGPTSRQRVCPTETRNKFSDRNLQTGINVWSRAQSELGTKTYWLTGRQL